MNQINSNQILQQPQNFPQNQNGNILISNPMEFQPNLQIFQQNEINQNIQTNNVIDSSKF
jgi:hypothetical protein